MKVLLVIALLVSVAYCLPAKKALDDDWAAYKKAFGREYGSEELKRRQIWETTVEKVAAHNREYDLGLKSYRLAVNKFADLTHEEFVQKYTGQRVPKLSGKRNVYKAGPITDADVDWRTKGYVTGVKDQGQCGSCWAFSTTGATEGQHFKATGQLVSLSEQNLVDCAGPEGDAGCDGGWMDYAFQYIIDNKGIDTEDSYPYEGVDGNCRFNGNTVGATISSFTDIPAGDENALTSASQSVGPIAVAIDASWNFQLYDGGVLDDDSCLNGHDDLNHGVLVVGYGSDGGSDYYIVKNSWGDSFGEQGYIRMSRNKNNQCGIATVASYPNV